jgi:hypothetical protein
LGCYQMGRSLWCDDCGDHVTDVGDPLEAALLREHPAICMGRVVQRPGSSGHWMHPERG